MAAKSNIIPTGKAKAKKLPKKASRAGKTGPKPAPQTDGEIEVVVEDPDLMPPEVLKQISRMNDLVSALDGMKSSASSGRATRFSPMIRR